MPYSNTNNSIARRRKRGSIDTINMTPMVDVMMVLLIIFMITAPLLTSGISLDLPKVGGKAIQGSDKSLDISVDKDGNIYLGEDEVDLKNLVARLKAMLSANPKMQIIISGDTQSSYGTIMSVMAELKNSGFTKVGLKTDKKDDAIYTK
ncbi:MAG: biopolymer transporter ExbD [Alphaproteobacteria bacterium]|nr:biopolymer transporter ExbD [Alphaproteobacteria bacterium]